MRFFCLVNPASGGRRGQRLLESMLSVRTSTGICLDCQAIDFSLLDEQLRLSRNYDRLIIAGGDGTVSSVMTRLDLSAPPVGIVALGTANDLARELGIFGRFPATDPRAIVAFFKTAPWKELTTWQLEFEEGQERTFRFVNYVSIGFDAQTVNAFNLWRKAPGQRFLKSLGVIGNRIAYTTLGCKYLSSRIKLPGLKVTADGQSLTIPGNRCRTLAFTNIQSMMGLGRSNFCSSAFDEQIELLKISSVFSYPAMVLKRACPLSPHLVGSARVWEVASSEPLNTLQLDGEPLILPDVCQLKISPGEKVKVLTAPGPG